MDKGRSRTASLRKVHSVVLFRRTLSSISLYLLKVQAIFFRTWPTKGQPSCESTSLPARIDSLRVRGKRAKPGIRDRGWGAVRGRAHGAARAAQVQSPKT